MPVQEQSRPQTSENSQYLNFDEYIEYQLKKTQSGIHRAEILFSSVVLASVLSGYLLLFAIFDQWVIPGGFSLWQRVLLLSAVAITAAAWAVWKIVFPYSRSINALYAAREIERQHPEFQSGLMTWVDLQKSGRPIPVGILEALERRTAKEFAKTNVEEAVDKRFLMRSSYVLLALVVGLCLYTLFSPKRMSTTLWRALMPLSQVAAATRTEIRDVKPGNSEVLARDQVEITAEIAGTIPPEVTLLFSTADRRFVNEPLTMRRVEGITPLFQTRLTGDGGKGLLSDVNYHVVAGDTHSENFVIRVNQPPTAELLDLTYDYPRYMRLEQSVQQSNTIDAWEGTFVTVRAQSNMPVKRAVVYCSDTEVAKESAEAYEMQNRDGVLSARWQLKFRDDGTFARFFHVQVWNERDQSDPQPTVYRIQIRPDLKPEVSLIQPTTDISLPANATLSVGIKAHDPDFMLRRVQLKVLRNSVETPVPPLFAAPPEHAEYSGKYELKLSQIEAKPGDTITIFGEAEDNFEPFDKRVKNIGRSQRINITVTDPVSETLQQQVNQQQQRELEEKLQKQQAHPDENSGAGNSQTEPQPTPADRDLANPSPQDQAAAAENQQEQSPQNNQSSDNGADSASGGGSNSGTNQNESGTGGEGQQGPGQQNSQMNSTASGTQNSQDSTGETGSENETASDSTTPAGMPPAGQGTNSNHQQTNSLPDQQATQQADQQASQNSDETNPSHPAGAPHEANKRNTETGSAESPASQPSPGRQAQNSGQQSATPPAEKVGEDQALQKLLDWSKKAEEEQQKQNSGTPKNSDAESQPDQSARTPQSPNTQSPNTPSPNSQPANPQQSAPQQSDTQQPNQTENQTENQSSEMPASDMTGQPPRDPSQAASQADSEKTNQDSNQTSTPNSSQSDNQTGNQTGNQTDATNQQMSPNSNAGEQSTTSNSATDPATQPSMSGSNPPAPAENQTADNTSKTTPQPNSNGTGSQQTPAPQTPMTGENPTSTNPASMNEQSGSSSAQTTSQSESPGPVSDPTQTPSGAKPPQPQPASETDPSGNSAQENPSPGSLTKPNPGANDQSPAESMKAPADQKPSDSGTETTQPSSTPTNPMSQTQPGDNSTSQNTQQATPQNTPDRSPTGMNQTGSENSTPAPDSGSPGQADQSGNNQSGSNQTSSDQTGNNQTGNPPNGASPRESGAESASGNQGEQSASSGSDQNAPAGTQPQNGETTSPGTPGSPNQSNGGNPGQSPAGAPQQGGVANGNQMPANGNADGAHGVHSGADPANLEHRKRATELALKRLQDEMKRTGAPDELMKELGFTEAELDKFMNRLQDRLADQGTDTSPEAESARRQFESLLKGLNDGASQQIRRGADRERESTESFGTRQRAVPPEYRRNSEAYKEKISK